MKNIRAYYKKYCDDRYTDKIWCIGYRKIDEVNDSFVGGKNVGDFKFLMPSFRYWYADPICHFCAGELYVFMEVYDMFKDIGRIGISKYLENGELTKPQIIIKENFHLSFPEVFNYNGVTYLIPESHSVNQIRIYRMNKNVFDWELYYVLDTPLQYSDSVVYLHENKVFLLCTSKSSDSKYKNKLSIFEIEKLETPNLIRFKPVSVGNQEYSYSMRNGGSICWINGGPVRVIQGSEEGEYGKKIFFREIKECNTEKGFIESEDFRILNVDDIQKNINDCKYDVLGIHTYGLLKNFEIIDLKISVITIFRIVRYYKKIFSMVLFNHMKHLKKRDNDD